MKTKKKKKTEPKTDFEKSFFKLMNNSGWKDNGKYEKAQRY